MLLVRFLIVIGCSLSIHSSFAFQFDVYSEDGKLGLINKSEIDTILNNQFEEIEWKQNDSASVKVIQAKKNDKWALYNTKGEQITRHQFNTLKALNENLFIASQSTVNSSFQYFGLLNTKGATIISFEYVTMKLHNDKIIASKLVNSVYQFGVFDLKGKELTPFHYSNISPLDNGYFSIENELRLQALFSPELVQITPFKYQNICSLDDGYFEVAVYDRKGVINEYGDLITPVINREIIFSHNRIRTISYPQWDLVKPDDKTTYYFDQTWPFGNELLVIQTGQNLSILNEKGNYLGYFENHQLQDVDDQFVSISSNETGYSGVINQAGKIMLPIIYDSIILNKTFVLGKINRANNENWFAYDTLGNKINETGYAYIKDKIGDITIAGQNEKVVLLSKSGNQITSAGYSDIEGLSNGHFLVTGPDGKGVLRSDGSWIITPYRDAIQLKKDHYYFKQGSAMGFIDLNGNILTKSYTDVLYLPLGYALKKESGYEIFDLENKLLTETLYDTISIVNDKTWLLQTLESKTLFKPTQQEFIELPRSVQKLGPYQEGYIGFLKDNQWGLMDDRGQLRISNRYDDIGSFSEGLCPFKLLDKWGVIDQAENIMVQPKYDRIFAFKHGLALVEINDKNGLIDKNGQIIIGLTHDEIYRYDKWISLEKDGYIGISNMEGKLIRSPQYDQVILLANGQFMVKKGQLFGIIDTDGKDIMPIRYQKILSSPEGYLGLRNEIRSEYPLK